MFGTKKQPEKPAGPKTRGEQLRDGDRELVAREGCRFSNDYFFLEFVKPAGESRGRYEIIGVRSDSLTVLAEHEQVEFGASGNLYGVGNEDRNPDGYVHMHRTDGQLAAMCRATRGMAAVADLAVAASRVARNAMAIGDGNASSAEQRIKLIEDFCWPMLRNLESHEVEQAHLGRARFNVQRQRDAEAASSAASRAEAEAKKAAATKKMEEEAEANTAAIRAAQAEMAAIRATRNQEWMAARAEQEAAEQERLDAWRAEQERLRAEAPEEERRLIEEEEAARS